MKNKLITEDVWQSLTKKVNDTKTKSYVAVAYFGQGAANMLPLNSGSILLVDASETAVKCGQTCPAELLKLYKKGVEIYSLPSLHAKIYVLGKTLLVGSANVSYNSSNVLYETLLSTTDINAVKNAKDYILKFCGADLGEKELTRLQKMYKPPKWDFNGGKKANGAAKNQNDVKSKLYVCELETNGGWTDEEQEIADIGEQEANSNRKETKRHSLHKFKWYGKLTMKKYDEVVQIYSEGKLTTVYPPGRLIFIKRYKYKGRNMAFCYVEVPDKEGIALSKIKGKMKADEFEKFNCMGYKNTKLAQTIYSWWR
jgi:hypothetical protein